MRKWLPALLLLGIAVAAGVYFFLQPPRPAAGNQSHSSASAEHTTVSTPSANTKTVKQVATNAFAGPVVAQAHPPAVTATETESFPVVLPEPDVPEEKLPQWPASTVLDNVRIAFHQYQSRFGGNPVGTNLEITRALNGENPRQVRFLRVEDGMRVNSKGELIDAWGTPYFFHQLSGTEMEIHSAGPDKKMWTADDLVIK
jgi:hypothetical protein